MFSEITYQQALAPEFVAYVQRTPDGLYTLAITYERGVRKGSSEIIPFSTESALKKFLDGETKDHVRYSTYRLLPGSTFPSNADAIQSTKRQPRQPLQPQAQQQQPAPEQEPSELQRLGYTKTESDTIISASYLAASQIRDSWFVDCDENKEVVFRWVNDMGLMPTPDNLGKAMDYLKEHNNLIRRNRKRGEPLPTTYISPTKVARDQTVRNQNEIEQLKNMPMEQLRELERRRQVEARKRLNLHPDFVL